MREPPHNLEAERKLLGGLLIDNFMIDPVVGIVRAQDFYRAAHSEVFAAIVELRDSGVPVDAVLLADELGRRGTFEKLGGDELLAEILNSAPHGANAVYHAHVVRKKAMLREVIQASTESIEECFKDQDTAEALVTRAEERVYKISERKVAGAIRTAEDLMGLTMMGIQARQDNEIDGVLTGFDDLDNVLCGLKPSQLAIVAGRPSMGKTAFAMNICQNAAQLVSVLFVSLEMNATELGERLVSSVARVDSNLLKKPWKMNANQKQAVNNAAEHIAKLRLKIDDSPSRTVSEIAAAARRIKSREGLDLLVVDYLSLIDSQYRKGESRENEVSRISRRLKAMARELKTPIIVLQQLNRQVESRESNGHRPRMADLRESGSIEQDADIILLLHRPEYYDINDQPGIAEVIIAKNRNGATGTEKLVFVKNCTRFDPLSHQVVTYGNGAAF